MATVTDFPVMSRTLSAWLAETAPAAQSVPCRRPIKQDSPTHQHMMSRAAGPSGFGSAEANITPNTASGVRFWSLKCK
ncbi:hypothetical protein ARTHRO8AJ_310015 [Arthrobacter sp. 8AJ]|nr:hypothetical protein ARTHRO8AJ_310015 [Arthrobacter sp. 8AJ]